jgi:hypothetical protein
MPERGQMTDRQLGRSAVICGDSRCVDSGEVPVDEHDRQPAGQQRLVPVRIRAGVGVQSGDEHDAGHTAIE